MQIVDLPHYCQHCGGVLTDASDNHFYRGICKKCGELTFMQHKVGIAAVVFKENQLLLLKRAQDPWKGYWNLPAGFLEYEESITDGVAREVFEEAGLNVNVLGLHHVVKYWDDPRGYGIVLFYDCEILDGEFISNDEVLEMKFFSMDEFPHEIAGAGHKEMLDLLLKEGAVNA
jgi:ADP-ribose pyrophosphatase YjhB (NUDIX family)